MEPRSKQLAPFPAAADRLDEITGVGRAAAQVLIAERRKRNHIRQLEALGYKVTLQPAA